MTAEKLQNDVIAELEERIASLEAHLASLEEITDDTYNDLWGLLYPEEPTSWEYPAQIVRHISMKIQELEAGFQTAFEALGEAS